MKHIIYIWLTRRHFKAKKQLISRWAVSWISLRHPLLAGCFRKWEWQRFRKVRKPISVWSIPVRWLMLPSQVSSGYPSPGSSASRRFCCGDRLLCAACSFNGEFHRGCWSCAGCQRKGQLDTVSVGGLVKPFFIVSMAACKHFYPEDQRHQDVCTKLFAGESHAIFPEGTGWLWLFLHLLYHSLCPWL